MKKTWGKVKKIGGKFKTGYNKFLKKHNISDDDVFGVMLIAGILGLPILIGLGLAYMPEITGRTIGIVVLLVLIYCGYVNRKAVGKAIWNGICEFFKYVFDLLGKVYELLQGILGFLLAIGIIVGIIALCSWLFGAVGGGVAGVLAVFFLLRLLKIL